MEPAKAQRTERRIGSSQKGDNNSIISKSDKNTTIDIKGAITLAITVTSFLLVLTFMETGNNSSNTAGSSVQIFGFLIIGVISFILFILVERKNPSPLVDLKLMLHKTILPANLMIMIIGFSMFMVFQTIPILVRNPPPLGFGEDAVNTGNVQLPFALVPVGIWAYLRFHNIKTRVSKTNYSWYNYYCKRFPWPINIPFK